MPLSVRLDTPRHASGFTLVELAIVLMIIGLLIGGILRGQELMENARVTSTLQQVKAYSGAIATFRDAYDSMPGDMPNALNRVPGCTATNFCANGDGNGRVGSNVPYAGTVGAVNTSINQIGNALPGLETTLFWKHLALASLISGVQPNADPANAQWGTTHPAAKINGGFVIFYSVSTQNDFGYGHVIRLQPAPNAMTASAAGAMAISPINGRKMDQKIDDGLPDSGDVTADFSGTNCDGGARYANLETLNCVMYFRAE